MAAAFCKLSMSFRPLISFTRATRMYAGLNNVAIKSTRSCSNESKSSAPVPQVELSPEAAGLKEFFDDPKNWGENVVKVGRAWRIEELRIKSNSDLHKLWYVLLKERNMLLTMEYNYKKDSEVFPNPERIDKVEESMENLEEVVRERNKAFYELETLETGEAPTVDQETPYGKLLNREIKEYAIPKDENDEWRKKQIHIEPHEITWFHQRYREQENTKKRRQERLHIRRVVTYITKFPDVDLEYLKELYPDVDVDKIKRKLDSVA